MMNRILFQIKSNEITTGKKNESLHTYFIQPIEIIAVENWLDSEFIWTNHIINIEFSAFYFLFWKKNWIYSWKVAIIYQKSCIYQLKMRFFFLFCTILSVFFSYSQHKHLHYQFTIISNKNLPKIIIWSSRIR